MFGEAVGKYMYILINLYNRTVTLPTLEKFMTLNTTQTPANSKCNASTAAVTNEKH